jgi:hypothetical protein
LSSHRILDHARIVIHSRSGPDGKLHLEVPSGRPDTEFDVELVVRPDSTR